MKSYVDADPFGCVRRKAPAGGVRGRIPRIFWTSYWGNGHLIYRIFEDRPYDSVVNIRI